MSLRTTLALALAAATLGCADAGGGGTAPPPASTAASAPAATGPAAPAAAAAAAAGTRFDGRYRGQSNLTLSRGNICGAQQAPRAITVRNGQAQMTYDTIRNRSAAGPVQADGSLAMRSESDMGTTITGRFANGRFQGMLRSGQCERSLDLRRVADAPA